MRTLILFLSIILSVHLFAAEELVTLKVDEFNIHGILRIPEAEEKLPVALIIAGSGPTDRDGNNPQMINNSLKMLAEGLNANGIATLNFDKRGIAASATPGQKEEDTLFEDMIQDVIQWVDFLKKDERFSRIIIIGHSEGSLIGMAASLDNPKVDAFVSLAGIAVPADEILKKQLGNQSPMLLEIVTPMIDQLKRGEFIENVDPMLYSLFRPSVQPYMISWLKYNPSEIIAKLNQPLLVINGTTDIQVEVDQAELLAKANPQAHLVIIENMNHVLKEVDGIDPSTQQSAYLNPDLPLKKELIPEIVSWIHSLRGYH